MSRNASRRDFLKQSSALGAAMWVGASVDPSAARAQSPNAAIRFACIGVDGKGSSDRDDAGKSGEIVALCDIDDERLARAAARYPNAKTYNDFRVMFDEMAGGIDAVTVSTPDHTHAPAAVRALKEGKHTFCQKPLTYTVAEARLLRELAAEKKLCTQMGNQGTAHTGLREAAAQIRRGDIGQVKEVHIWTNRPIWPQGGGRPTEVETCPENVHWDLFLGPAPERPYSSQYHPFKWRGWLDFGTGALGDMACHTLNMAAKALDLFDPVSLEAFPDPEWTGEARKESYPKFSRIVYEFGQRGDFAPCKLFWYDGGQRPDNSICPEAKFEASGSLVIGEKGMIHSSKDYHEQYGMYPAADFKSIQKPEVIKSPGHFIEFANAIKENKPELAMSNFDYAGRLTETVLLGNVALRAGKKIMWDGPNMKITNAPDAQQYVSREYRKGWEL